MFVMVVKAKGDASFRELNIYKDAFLGERL